MDVDDDDDFYAPAEDTSDGSHQHEQQAPPQTGVKSGRPEEDLEEGEEEDEGEDDGSDSVRHVLVAHWIYFTYHTSRISTSSLREKMAQRLPLRREYFIDL